MRSLLTYPGMSWPIPMDRACFQEYTRKIGMKIRQLLSEIFKKNVNQGQKHIFDLDLHFLENPPG